MKRVAPLGTFARDLPFLRMKSTRKFTPPQNALKPAPRAVLGRIKVSYPRIQHLLVPLDFSGKSRQALRYAMPIAEKFSAKIHLVHVLPPVTKANRAELPRQREKAMRRLNLMSMQILSPVSRTENLVLTGEPARQILAAAEKINADLIVLTTKGRSGLSRLLMGSTAEYIMRHAKCPIVSVRRQ